MEVASPRQDSFHSQKGLLSPRPTSAPLGTDDKKGSQPRGLHDWRKSIKRSVKNLGAQPKQVVIEVGRTVTNKARNLSGKLVKIVKKAVKKERKANPNAPPKPDIHFDSD
eukprot:evm.model.scf_1859EXC.2 EVM.evm.TU.scf_1859EXC.2   scf_1859EXC:10402-10731(+)